MSIHQNASLFHKKFKTNREIEVDEEESIRAIEGFDNESGHHKVNKMHGCVLIYCMMSHVEA